MPPVYYIGLETSPYIPQWQNIFNDIKWYSEAQRNKLIGGIVWYKLWAMPACRSLWITSIYNSIFLCFCDYRKIEKVRWNHENKTGVMLKYNSWAVQEARGVNNVSCIFFFFTPQTLPLSPKASPLVVCKLGIYLSGTSKPSHIHYTYTENRKRIQGGLK